MVLLLLSVGCAAPRAGEGAVGEGAAAGRADTVTAASGGAATAGADATDAAGAALLGGALPDACEPSALVHVGETWIVGDNETEDRLFVYDEAMRPLAARPLASRVEDVEAVAVDGAQLIVVGSHSRNKSAKLKPDRRRILDGAASYALDFSACAGCVAVEPMAPNDGGLNLEGAAMLAGKLVLGARSPLDGGKAMLFTVSRTGKTAGQIEATTLLDLRGLGVRELAPFRGGLLVLAGPPVDGAAPHHLWWLPALDAAPVDLGVDLPTSAEGLWPRDDTHLRYVVDGDGEAGACKVAGVWGEVVIPAAAR